MKATYTITSHAKPRGSDEHGTIPAQTWEHGEGTTRNGRHVDLTHYVPGRGSDAWTATDPVTGYRGYGWTPEDAMNDLERAD